MFSKNHRALQKNQLFQRSFHYLYDTFLQQKIALKASKRSSHHLFSAFVKTQVLVAPVLKLFFSVFSVYDEGGEAIAKTCLQRLIKSIYRFTDSIGVGSFTYFKKSSIFSPKSSKPWLLIVLPKNSFSLTKWVFVHWLF